MDGRCTVTVDDDFRQGFEPALPVALARGAGASFGRVGSWMGPGSRDGSHRVPSGVLRAIAAGPLAVPVSRAVTPRSRRPYPPPMLRAIPFALLLVACTAASSGSPPEDVPPEPGTCAAIEGSGCACGASLGTWRCVGEMPICVCSTPDAAGDVTRDAGLDAVDVRAEDSLGLEVVTDVITDTGPDSSAMDVSLDTARPDTGGVVPDVPRCDAGTICGGACCTFTCCNGACVNTQESTLHCGGCGTACDVAHGLPSCSFGNCRVGACLSPFLDCDRNSGNGCEVDPRTSWQNCGACGHECGGFERCVSGRCESCPVYDAGVDVTPIDCADTERACIDGNDCAICTPVRGFRWICVTIAGRARCIVPSVGECR